MRAFLLAAAFFLPRPALAAGGAPLQVFVSVLPQKFLARQVAGERAEISVLVGPGQNPHSYEPTPRQMARLDGADLYFRIGVSFEDAWMSRLAAASPSMRIVDCRQGIELRKEEAVGGGSGGGPDPHVWTNPILAGRVAGTMRDAFIEADGAGRKEYEENYSRLAAELEVLDGRIRDTLRDVTRRTFLVLHPSWGYFADAYGLEQIAIERGGGEPGARQLAGLIDRAKREGIRVVFVQEQVSRRTAEAVAKAVGGRVVTVDPLAEDYIENLLATAGKFAEAMK